MDLWKRRRIKIVVMASIGFICLSMAAVLFTIGGIFYTIEKSKILNYASTTCTITRVSTKTLTCIIYMFYGQCHVASWRVHRQDITESVAALDGTTHHKGSSGALKEANTYPVGSEHSCWYDIRQRSITQLTQPSTQLADILLASGGLAILISGVCLYYMCLLVQQQSRQQEEMTPRVRIIFLK